MRQDPDGSVVITLRDVYDKVVSVEGTVQTIRGQAGTVADHEARIRKLERCLYALPPMGGLSIGSLLYAIYGGHHG
jgi:hypothetical protein